MDSKYRLRILALVVLSMCASFCRASDTACKADYTVEYIVGSSHSEMRQGLGKLKVMSFDSGTGEERRLREAFREEVHGIDCEDRGVEQRPDARPFIPDDLLQNEEIRALAARWPDSTELWAFRTSCHNERGLAGFTCWFKPAHRQSGDPDSRALFYCLYDQNSAEVVFVDALGWAEGIRWRKLHVGFFDFDGSHFYYNMGDLAKRFDIIERHVDTIPGGSIPLVPWNRPGLAVYSATKKEFRLLDDRWQVKATIIHAELPGDELLSCYALDDSTFAIGVSFEYPRIYPYPVDRADMMTIYVLDFGLGTACCLLEPVPNGEILSVERRE